MNANLSGTWTGELSGMNTGGMLLQSRPHCRHHSSNLSPDAGRRVGWKVVYIHWYYRNIVCSPGRAKYN